MLLGYVRVSSDDQVLGSSPETQERVIRGMAMANGIDAFDIQIYIDNGVSGAIPLSERPEGGRLFADAKPGDVIVASKLDRIFRDALDALTCYTEFKKRGIDLILYDMGPEPVTRDGMSKVFFIMLSAFAELERNRINDRVREGKKAKKAAGGHTGGDAPYGFRIVGRGRDARLEPNPDEQPIIEMVKDMLPPPGHRCRPSVIRRQLTEAGVVNRKGNPLADMQVKRLIAKVREMTVQ